MALFLHEHELAFGFHGLSFSCGRRRHQNPGNDLLRVGKAEMSENFVKDYTEVQAATESNGPSGSGSSGIF
jgi:hypothetical protein